MDWVSEDLVKSKMAEELKDQQPKEKQEPENEPPPESPDEKRISFEDTLKVIEMAYSQMLQGRFDEAESTTSAFLTLAPDFWYFHSLMGVIHLQAVLAEYKSEGGKEYSLDVAENSLNKAFELNPNDISVYVNRAEVRLHKGDLEGAFEILKQVSVVDPELKDPYTARARQFTLEVIHALERLEAGEEIEDDDEEEAPEAAKPAP